ncbi:hypothetical protein PC118_g23152 [Phytophthora cactorum]|uniref:Uncharacterized protein n=1 Tax=Phytophthora cactorum TaxID=29920 RepID=A0A8T1ERE7_9STRA|nr:hypothetical protein PC118_g23152 [Phytophthora cactorum]
MKHFKSIQNLTQVVSRYYREVGQRFVDTSCKFSTLYAVLHLASVSSQQQKARSITPGMIFPACRRPR